MNPKAHTEAATQNTRLLHIRACSHCVASLGSAGHCWGRTHNVQAVAPSRAAEMVNIHGSYSVRVTRSGIELVSEATTAPNPRLTRRIGSAQHSRVPKEAKSASQLSARC